MPALTNFKVFCYQSYITTIPAWQNFF